MFKRKKILFPGAFKQNNNLFQMRCCSVTFLCGNKQYNGPMHVCINVYDLT